jgi:sarcosine oxidase
VAREFGIKHEIFDGAEVARRFPQFLGLAGNEKAYFEPGGGYVLPERCISAQLTRAAQLGARVRTNVEVRSISQHGNVRIETSDGTIEAGQVVVSAGSWTAPLLSAPFDRLLTVNRQVLHWYELEDLAAYGENAPAFIWMHGATDVDYFYGFPPLPGDRRVKVATEQYETRTTADTINREVARAESDAMYRKHVQGRLAGAKGRVAHAAACLYTVTPDRGFIIDRHPRQDRVFVVSACSGHGFKHSAGIGNVVAERLTEGRNQVDLTPFSIARFR